ncbi:hypothetical protein [Streptomyces sp. NPDC048644]|uniref:hypothetical protein n=1 Tax=Streptomyces sp. NPDC048644 TaxID=3365582 RepID=UPI00371B238A
MTSWLYRRSLQLWGRLLRDVDSNNPTTKWTTRIICAVPTVATGAVLGHVATWTCEFVGAPPYLTGVAGLLVVMNVFCFALVAVTAGPGRTRKPALLTLATVTGFVLFVTWPR